MLIVRVLQKIRFSFNFHNKEIVYDCAARAKGLIYNEHATANEPLK